MQCLKTICSAPVHLWLYRLFGTLLPTHRFCTGECPEKGTECPVLILCCWLPTVLKPICSPVLLFLPPLLGSHQTKFLHTVGKVCLSTSHRTSGFGCCWILFWFPVNHYFVIPRNYWIWFLGLLWVWGVWSSLRGSHCKWPQVQVI